MPKPRARFRIKTGRGQRFEFRIYDTLADMRKACGIRGSYGCCESEPASEVEARIFLARGNITPFIVLHECVHAAMCSVKFNRKSPETEDGEEDLADTTARLNIRFWKRWSTIERRLSAT